MSSFIGKGATSSSPKLFPYNCNTASLQQWAAVIYDSADAGNSVKAPTAANNAGWAGFLADAQPAAGTTAGVVYNFARMPGEKVPVLLVASEAVTVGDPLCIANTSGHVRKWLLASDDDGTIVAFAEQTVTAGATAELIQARIAGFDVHKDAS